SEEREASGEGWECSVIAATDPLAGARSATCSEEKPLAAGASSAPIVLHVYVREEAKEPAANKVTVSGGGAPEVKEQFPTEVESVPFGIASFRANVEAEHEEETEKRDPYHRAGGHPFSVTTNFVLNFVPNPTGTGLEGAGSGVKEAQVELPPG